MSLGNCQLVKSQHPPQGAISCGRQNDGAGTLYTAVAHTPQGNIPGKAQGNTCWYPYGGREHSTHNFSYVTVRRWALVRSAFTPENAIGCGHQNDGAGTLYAGVAHTSHGDIPGKAQGSTCWYPYGGSEHTTNIFSYVVQEQEFTYGMSITSTLTDSNLLQRNQELRSSNGRYRAVMQGDGNFVLYENGDRPYWATNTHGTTGSRMVMQSDGNLVLYDDYDRPIWASNTYRQGVGPYRLDLQNDRNLVVYDATNRPTWASQTNI